jgi:hypothetical protein
MPFEIALLALLTVSRRKGVHTNPVLGPFGGKALGKIRYSRFRRVVEHLIMEESDICKISFSLSFYTCVSALFGAVWLII